MDTTLGFDIAGDDGASAEGGRDGRFDERTDFDGVPESVPEMLELIDDPGGPKSHGHFAADSRGGTRNGPVIRWPEGIAAGGEVRSRWHHVIGGAPTIHERSRPRRGGARKIRGGFRCRGPHRC